MMDNAGTLIHTHDESVRYPSMVSLKDAHIQLLKRHRKGDTEEVLAEIETFIRKGSATGALLDSEDDRSASQSLLDYWATVFYRVNRIPPDTTLAEFDSSLAPKLSDALSPYVGLSSFQEEDKDKFFGRERSIENMISALRESRLLVVIGPSGSGKSSLVLAGLLPVLRNGALSGSEDWHYFPRLVPGSNPLRSLARAIKPSDNDLSNWVELQAEGFKKDKNHLLSIITQSQEASSVIVVDQFEEIFTMCTDDEQREAFIDNLVSLVQAPSRRHSVIITIRSDYEPRMVKLPALLPFYEQGQVRVTPLTAADLTEAIEEPAKQIGLKFEDGIVNELVRDILGEPAGLPLLQFALLRLWKTRERNRITWKAYKALGGARQALALSADEFYQGLIYEDQKTAKRILLKLVRPSEGLEVTNNRVKRRALYKTGEGTDQVNHVLNKLVSAGLVRLTKEDTPDDDRVEVAHEALVRNWPTLVGWLEDERTYLRQRLRLTAAVEQWIAHNEDKSALLGGSLLEEALRYEDLNELETEFVQASQIYIQQEKEAARKRELDLERAQLQAEEQKRRAEEEAKNARKFRRLTYTLALVILLALAATSYAFFAEGKARKQAKLAETAQKEAEVQKEAALQEKKKAEEQKEIAFRAQIEAEKQQKEADKQKELALQEKKKAEEQKEIAERSRREVVENRLAVKNLLSESLYMRGKGELLGGEPVNALLNFEEALKGVTGNDLNTSPILSKDDLQEQLRFLLPRASHILTGQKVSLEDKPGQQGHIEALTSAVFSKDRKRVLTTSNDGTAKIWDTETGKMLHSLETEDGAILHAELSPNGKLVVTSDRSNKAKIWDTETGKMLHQLKFHKDIVYHVAFSADSNLVVTASLDENAVVWNALTGEKVQEIPAGESLYYVEFSKEGPPRLITLGLDSTPKIWDAQTGYLLGTLKGHKGVIYMATFSPNGEHVVTASKDGTARIWDAKNGLVLKKLEGHKGAVNYAEFSRDNNYVVTGGADGTARIWDANTGDQVVLLEGHKQAVLYASFSPLGNYVVTASSDKTAKVWDVRTGELRATLAGHTGSIKMAVFGPDEKAKLVLTASSDKTAKIWNWDEAAKYNAVVSLKGHSDEIGDATFSPDSNLVATASADHTARIWDVKTGKRLQLLEHGDEVSYVAFSKDNKLLTASNDGTAKVWDAKSGTPISTLTGHVGKVYHAAFSPNGKFVVTGGADKTARVWEAETGRLVQKFEGHSHHVHYAMFNPHSTRIVTASDDFKARIWDVNTGKSLHTLEGHTYRLVTAMFSPNGKLILTASEDGTARLWDAETGNLIYRPLDARAGSVSYATFSPNGRWVVTAHIDGTARIWDVSSGKIAMVIDGQSSLASAEFDKDSKFLVTASKDQTAKIWYVKTGELLYTLSDHTKEVNRARFSPDGHYIVTASGDGTAKVWDISADAADLNTLAKIASDRVRELNLEGKKLIPSAWNRAIGERRISPEDIKRESSRH